MRKDKVISVRLTDQEFALLAEQARTDNKRISEVIRQRLFRPTVPAASPIRWEAGYPVNTTGTAPATFSTYYWNTSGGANT